MMIMHFPLSCHFLWFVKPSITLFAIASLSVLPGCGGESKNLPVTSEASEQAEISVHEEHDYHIVGPHGGHLIELGKRQYHAEVVFEPNNQRLAVYLLGPRAENSFVTAQETFELAVVGGKTIILTADDVDLEGEATQFVAMGDSLAGLKRIADLRGSISLEINGETYTGAIDHDNDHHPHSDEGASFNRE